MSNIRNKIRLPACSGTARAEARRQGRSPDPTRAFKPMAGETAAKHLYELGELNRLRLHEDRNLTTEKSGPRLSRRNPFFLALLDRHVARRSFAGARLSPRIRHISAAK